MSNVVKLEYLQTHYTIKDLKGNYHVVPQSMVNDIINGSLSIYTVNEELLKAIIADWKTTT